MRDKVAFPSRYPVGITNTITYKNDGAKDAIKAERRISVFSLETTNLDGEIHFGERRFSWRNK